jgi:hypothetical protein
MDFKDELKALGNRVAKLLPHIHTEEATKNALIMPFLQILGYDVFNPFEVLPEYVADIGIKKGEKVDYAIIKDSLPVILIECKLHSENLDPHNSQLFRYFHTSKARFGILTNGVVYRFYTDLIEKNKMDEKPFFECNITDLKEADVIELKKFHKSNFDVDLIVNSASELKYSNEIKGILTNEFKNPSEDFVRFFTSKVYEGRATQNVIGQFTEIVKRSVNQLISDMISERLKSALAKEVEIEKEEIEKIAEKEEAPSDGIVTTDEELEGFQIVKAILRSKVPGDRIVYKDTISYFGILFDGNTRKPLCRLHFNGKKKYLGLFDATKTETKHELPNLDAIHNFSSELLSTLSNYLQEN